MLNLFVPTTHTVYATSTMSHIKTYVQRKSNNGTQENPLTTKSKMYSIQLFPGEAISCAAKSRGMRFVSMNNLKVDSTPNGCGKK